MMSAPVDAAASDEVRPRAKRAASARTAGQVRYFAGSNAAGDQALYTTGSVSDFRAYACGPD